MSLREGNRPAKPGDERRGRGIRVRACNLTRYGRPTGITPRYTLRGEFLPSAIIALPRATDYARSDASRCNAAILSGRYAKPISNDAFIMTRYCRSHT